MSDFLDFESFWPLKLTPLNTDDLVLFILPTLRSERSNWSLLVKSLFATLFTSSMIALPFWKCSRREVRLKSKAIFDDILYLMTLISFGISISIRLSWVRIFWYNGWLRPAKKGTVIIRFSAAALIFVRQGTFDKNRYSPLITYLYHWNLISSLQAKTVLLCSKEEFKPWCFLTNNWKCVF